MRVQVAPITPSTTRVPIIPVMTPSTTRVPIMPVITPSKTRVPIVPVITQSKYAMPVITPSTPRRVSGNQMGTGIDVTDIPIVPITQGLINKPPILVPPDGRIPVKVNVYTDENIAKINVNAFEVRNEIERSIVDKVSRGYFREYTTDQNKYMSDLISIESIEKANPNEIANIIRRGRAFYIVNKVKHPVIEYMMKSRDLNFAIEVIRSLGLSKFTDNADVCYNLLWYINMDNRFNKNLSQNELEYISSLNETDLTRILGPNYIIYSDYDPALDRASLLFALISGYKTARPYIKNLEPRYSEIKNSSPLLIAFLAFDIYDIVGYYNFSDLTTYSKLPPYIFIASKSLSKIALALLNVSLANLNDYMDQYGILLPTDNIPNTNIDRLKYFINEFKNYEKVLDRPGNISPPPDLQNMNQQARSQILNQYTTREIVNAYEPIADWSNRSNLINIIIDEYRNNQSRWTWRNKHCNNDDTYNIIEAERHGDVNKDDRNDPTLSYGTIHNYRCYQIEELIASFREYNGEFIFRVPDWTAPVPGIPVPINPTTRAPLESTFSIESIRQLRELLRDSYVTDQIRRLLTVIDTGLEFNNEVNAQMRTITNQFNKLNNDEQNTVKLYLAWLFIYGMWMRFWKGPGNPWPVSHVFINQSASRLKENRCDPSDRDEHIFIQQSILTTLREIIEKDKTLATFIDSLPRIEYNLKNNTVKRIMNNKVNALLNNLLLGQQCMGLGADYLIETSYYYIIKFFGGPNYFNEFINQMMPAVLDLERQVVSYQLAFIKDPDTDPQAYSNIKDTIDQNGNVFQTRDQAIDLVRTRLRILRERQLALGTLNNPNPTPNQPDFNPNIIKPNAHT